MTFWRGIVLAGIPMSAVLAQSPPGSIARLGDLVQLCRFEPGVTTRQFASTDPSGRGHDHGHWLREANGRFVLAESEGPGVIARIWSANPAGRLLVTLDGETEPRIACAFADLFADKYAPFCAPIATRKSGGAISYFPIPYAKSCRVELSDLAEPDALYWQVHCVTWPKGTPMRTFTRELPDAEQQALARVLARWRAPDPFAGQTDRKAPERAWLGPGQFRDLVNAPGPGVVDLLAIGIEPNTVNARALQLEVGYEGASEPSICVPVLDFFGVGFGARPFASLAIGWSETWNQGWCVLPMPYAKRLRMTVRNLDAKFAAGITWEVRRRVGEEIANAGLLHAEFRTSERVGAELYELARIEGRGKLVGITQAMQGVGDLWYLEGNEQITIDGAKFPQLVGTGTEDFYNGGYYWSEGTFALPLHGLNEKQEWITNRTMPFRFFVPDAIGCERSLVARLEHGSSNQVKDAYYSSVAYWYGERHAVRRPKPAELCAPRLWAVIPQGFTPAASLEWRGDGRVDKKPWEALTSSHRGLDRPLFQAFPISYVEQDAPARDTRVVLLGQDQVERRYTTTFEAPHADRFRLALRAFGATPGPRVALAIDGKPIGTLETAASVPAPLAPQRFMELGLTAGPHELSLVVPPGIGAAGIDAFELAHASPFVRSWLVSPPVKCAREETVESAPPVEALLLAPAFDASAAGWKRITSDGDAIDLGHHVSKDAPVVAYLSCTVESRDARVARVMLGSDDGVRVWVNGELAWSKSVHRPLSVDEDRFDVRLVRGPNRLLVKVRNDGGGYALAMRVANPDGGLVVR